MAKNVKANYRIVMSSEERRTTQKALHMAKFICGELGLFTESEKYNCLLDRILSPDKIVESNGEDVYEG